MNLLRRNPPLPPPASLFAAGQRHLFVFAHQDDDLPYAGILHRALPQARVLWVTNGDGLAPAAGIAPAQYAEIRKGEAQAALNILGYRPEQLEFLGHSELFFYPLFAELTRYPQTGAVPRTLQAQVLEATRTIETRLRARVEEADVVWTLAWQGGHPEHDLTHFLTARMVRVVASAQQRHIEFLELPAYEMTVLVPLRFAPWHRGRRFRLALTDEELRRKEAAFKAYRSQEKLTNAFKQLIRFYGLLNTARLRPFGFRAFAREEEFGPVPDNRDYTRSPHGLDLFDYIFEDYEGTRIPFDRSIARIVKLVTHDA